METLLIAVVAPRTGKIIKNSVFWKSRRKFATKWYITLQS